MSGPSGARPVSAPKRPTTDGEMLRLLADYFDLKDASDPEADDEVQRDLRRIAARLDALDDVQIAAIGGPR